MENVSTVKPAGCWRPGVVDCLGYYVYLLVDPRTDRPFYVGKGVGGRCFAHIEQARRTTADATGDYPKLTTIREIEATGRSVRIEILSHALQEAVALAVEAAAISLLGIEDLTNKVHGHHVRKLGVDDVNARYGAQPAVVDPSHRIVLIRVSRHFHGAMGDEAIYEVTRKWWRVGPRRRLVGSPRAPEWAFTVFEGVVRAVFRIEKWHPPEEADVAADARRRGRWCFVGARDSAMDEKYRLTDVTAHLPPAAQGPLRFLNCGKGQES